MADPKEATIIHLHSNLEGKLIDPDDFELDLEPIGRPKSLEVDCGNQYASNPDILYNYLEKEAKRNAPRGADAFSLGDFSGRRVTAVPIQYYKIKNS